MKSLRIVNVIFWIAMISFVITLSCLYVYPMKPTAFQLSAMVVMYVALPACMCYAIDIAIKECLYADKKK